MLFLRGTLTLLQHHKILTGRAETLGELFSHEMEHFRGVGAEFGKKNLSINKEYPIAIKIR